MNEDAIKGEGLSERAYLQDEVGLNVVRSQVLGSYERVVLVWSSNGHETCQHGIQSDRVGIYNEKRSLQKSLQIK